MHLHHAIEQLVVESRGC